MENLSLLVGFGTSLVVILAIGKLFQARKNAKPLPGPKGLPLIGNLRDLPPPGTFAPYHWVKHKEMYGPISSINVLGDTIIILNEAQVAFDLLEKKSLTFSGRHRLWFLRVVGWGNATGSLQYDETLRIHRKHFARMIGTQATASQFDELQEAEVAHFLLHMLDDPENLEAHIIKEVGSVILQIVYGYSTENFKKDPLLSLITRVMERFALSAVPGAYLVNNIPMLRYVPSWFPGAGWKKEAKLFSKDLKESIDKPYSFVEHQMAQGNNNKSFLSQLIDPDKQTPEDKDINKWVSASMFQGGSDTTVASLSAFFMAMTLYPDVQKKAQEEIDRVVGSERLPTPDDRDRLPYVGAIVTEIIRWWPVGPMGLPHKNMEETTYRGYRIPKSSILMANIWAFTHDPTVYKNPMEFWPERFLEGQGREPEFDPRKLSFGFGRRICPGKVLAENTLFLSISQSLAVFQVAKKVVDGKVIVPKVEPKPGVISHPAHFETSIKPRSPHHEELIRSLEKKFPWKESDARALERMET
ncbi:flavonoid 3-hydroxylase [Colletotrichum zoysiae]|uniref:Flavonoid 3-hydroxylase n=1 Tax=Colletotrichum zoysiae TaxID=1216348 RepID=A0AAD9M3M9_9PEZI|nr:flavonoid 3-hydroxylase [Colletotrichum zoysiae]